MHLAILLIIVGFALSEDPEAPSYAIENDLNFPFGLDIPGEVPPARIQSEDDELRENPTRTVVGETKAVFSEKSEDVIVKEINIDDLKDFHHSWNNAGRFVTSARYVFLMEVKTVLIDKESIYFRFKSSQDKNWVTKKWSELEYIPNLRFRVKTVELQSEISLETLDKLGNGDRFTNYKNKTTLVWDQQGENAVPNFRKLFNIFNITAFDLDEFYGFANKMDPGLFSLPEFQRLHSVTLPQATVPDEILPKLQSDVLFVEKLASHPNIYSTVNTYFKQWYAKRRNIKIFAMRAEIGKDMTKTIEAFLPGIPFSFVWSYENHDSSAFSDFDKDSVAQYADSGSIYVVDRGDKKLLIFLFDETVGALEVVDEKKHLTKFMFQQDIDYEWENPLGSDDSDEY